MNDEINQRLDSLENCIVRFYKILNADDQITASDVLSRIGKLELKTSALYRELKELYAIVKRKKG